MIGTLLVNCAWKSTVLLSLAWAASLGLRERSAALRHLVWVVALISALLLPLLQSIPFVPRPTAPVDSSRPVQSGAATASSLVVDAIDSLPHHRMVGRWLGWIWLAGALLFAVRLFASIAALWRRRRAADDCADAGILREADRCAHELGLTRSVGILLSRVPCGMPSTFGLFRPVILLPSDCVQWPEARLRVVLLHEMSHIRRVDWVIGLLAQVCLVLYWFHPLMWMGVHRLREESEAASDDMVLAAGEDASIYAEELLNVIRGALRFKSAPPIAIAMARGNHLERRITTMLNDTIERRRVTRKAMLLTTMAALLALLPLSALRSSAQNAPGSLGGTVLDPSGAAVPAVTVIATNRATRSRDMTATDSAGAYRFDVLPPGDYEVRFLVPGFAEHRESIALPTIGNSTHNVSLELGALSEKINVSARRTNTAAPSTAAPQRILVGGSVQAANLIRQVKPPYPESAKAAGIQGAVILEATIGPDGIPSSLEVMNSSIDPELARAAVQAVKQWLYRPTLLNGKPVEVRTNITVNFTLTN